MNGRHRFWNAYNTPAIRFGAFAIITAALLCLLIVSGIGSPLRTVRGLFTSSPSSKPAQKTSEPYDWRTYSSFGFVAEADVANATIDELCAHFPTSLLRDVQPILKTGHGVLESRLATHLRSVSACLGQELLIVSDKAEVFEGHPVLDAIAETPAALLNSHHTQLAAYEELHSIPSWSSDNETISQDRKESWRIDKFKFLASASAAWRLRPEKRWYVFYEDDTYVLWDNVFRFVANFDPDRPWYFGSPTLGKTDKALNYRTSFANGGPGFIMSREAIRRITADDWDSQTGEYLGSVLTGRHWEDLTHDCCGDSIMGWALWQRNVSLSGIWPLMNPHPPHAVPFGDPQWCQPIMTMHKPQSEAMEPMWRWEWSARQVDRPLLYRDLALSFHQLDSMANKEHWRNDGRGTYDFAPNDPGHQSAAACAKACEDHPRCMQWTYKHDMKCIPVGNFLLGKEAEPVEDEVGKSHDFTSGWNTARIREWAAARPCNLDQVRWSRPSLTRIF